ncbi:hypothetical protein ABPG75_003183 [Micractinium tetrahymenae]
MTLVSRCWHSVFFSTPPLWRSFSASRIDGVEAEPFQQFQQEQRLAARHRLLQRVGRHVQRFVGSTAWRTDGTPLGDSRQVADFLALLHPGTLQEASLAFEAGLPLDSGVLPAVSSLTAFPNLRALTLEVPERFGLESEFERFPWFVHNRQEH